MSKEEIKELNEEAELPQGDSPDPTEEAKELTPEETLKSLQERRMGTFKVDLSLSDATYLRNLVEKTKFKGPQQAYLILIAKSEMTQVRDSLKDLDKTERHTVDITSATIESLSYFMNNMESVGTESANKLFAASMILRPAISQINQLDQEISELQKTIQGEK